MELRNMCCPMRHVALIITIIILSFGWSHTWDYGHWSRDHEYLDQDYYTAAVYEHNRQYNSSFDAAANVKSNLEYYKKATKIAKQQGADIILFPEYGIFPPLNRSQLKKYLEIIPNPKEVSVTPCDQRKLFADRQIMYSLSCMAKKNKIFVVVNVGELQKCGGKTGCPEDGDLHLNTNVVFNREGTLIAKYAKERLYFELGMDLPLEIQDPTFETDFGKFATFICFDIIFEKLAVTSQKVDAIFFSTMWMDMSPFYMATQSFQAWAIGNNATILASNIQKPGYLATGSGIFRGRLGAVAQTHNPDGISKLIVAQIPKHYGGVTFWSLTGILKNSIINYETDDDGKFFPEVCSHDVLGPAKNIDKDYRCLDEKVRNYTLIKLHKAEGHLEACNNNMCCELDYAANNMDESYYFGVYNGSYNAFHFNRYRWWEENCFLARCDDLNGTACSTFPPITHKTLFHKVSMRANFTTKYIYPSFVSNRMKLVPVENWTFNNEKPERSSITMNSDWGIPLLAATLKGRVYDRDPPYIR